jgi:hypothetical protein
MTDKNTNLEIIAEKLRRKNKLSNNNKKEEEIVFSHQGKGKYNHKTNWNTYNKKCFNCN